MSFERYINVLSVLAESPIGATIGRIQKKHPQLTRGMVERTMRDLIGEGFVRLEKVFYRKGIEAKIYHINEVAVEFCGYVMTGYHATEHQRTYLGDMPESIQSTELQKTATGL